MRERSEYEISAYHEAGHVAIRIVLGIGPFVRVVLLREPADGRAGYLQVNEDSLGRTQKRDKPEPVAPAPEILPHLHEPEYVKAINRMLCVQAVFAYSGIAAQDPRTPGDWCGSRLAESSAGDRESLAYWFRCFGRAPNEHAIDGRALRAARRLIDAHWGAVRAIAEALVERLYSSGGDGVLTYDEALAIFKTAPRLRNPWRERELTRAQMATLREQWRREAEEYDEQWRKRKSLGPRAERRRGRFLDPGPMPGGLLLPAPLAGLLAAETEA